MIQASNNQLSSSLSSNNEEGDLEERSPEKKSVLLMKDISWNTPLHNLWDNLGDTVPSALLQLILESCGNGFVTIQDLLSVQNGHGMTVLHLLSGDAGCSIAIFKAIIYPLSLSTIDDEKYKMHPVLCGDEDGELPFHFACYVGLEPEKMKLLLNGQNQQVENTLKEETSSVYGKCTPYCKAMLQSLFCASKENMVPLDALFYWFVQEHQEEIHCNISYPSPQQVDFENLIPYILNYDQNFNDGVLLEKIANELWPRIRVVLEFVVELVTDWFHEDGTEEFSPLHLAAAVPTFPSAVLKTAALVSLHNADESFYLAKERVTGSNYIPLHIAASTKPIEMYSYCKSAECHREMDIEDMADLTVWQSSREPRSMIQYMLEQEKSSASVVDQNGRLPLHIAIENGLEYYANVKPLVEVYVDGLVKRHPRYGLFPFMLAAAFNEIDAIYGLLLKDPSVCRLFAT